MQKQFRCLPSVIVEVQYQADAAFCRIFTCLAIAGLDMLKFSAIWPMLLDFSISISNISRLVGSAMALNTSPIFSQDIFAVGLGSILVFQPLDKIFLDNYPVQEAFKATVLQNRLSFCFLLFLSLKLTSVCFNGPPLQLNDNNFVVYHF